MRHLLNSEKSLNIMCTIYISIFYYKMKICCKCRVKKPLEGFYKDKSKKDGRYTQCKECEKMKKKKFHKLNREKLLKQMRKRWKENKVARNKAQRDFYYKNKKRLIANVMAYERKRKKVDEGYRIMKRIRGSCSKRILYKNNKTSQQLTGCTWEYLKQWIESQMTDSMTFNTIHIDHMLPLASFDLTKPEEQLKACHYTNLQPMLPSENMSKGSKIIYDMRWNGQQWEIKRHGKYEVRDKRLI